MSKTIDIFFRGDIAPGHALVEVQEQLKKLFRADDEQIQRLFSGRPVAIRRGLSQEEAERYRDAILEAGALVELRAAKSDSEQTTEPAQSGCQATPTAHGAEEEMPAGNAANTDNSTAGQSTPEDDDGLSLAPLGADVLNADERTRVEGVDVDISALDVCIVLQEVPWMSSRWRAICSKTVRSVMSLRLKLTHPIWWSIHPPNNQSNRPSSSHFPVFLQDNTP